MEGEDEFHDNNPPPPPPVTPTQQAHHTLSTIKHPILKKDLVEMMNLRRCRNTFSSRFQSLLSQLEIHGAGVSTKDANQKFLRVFESDIKGSTTSSSSTQNVTFVSSKSTNSTNDVSTAYGVSTSSGHNSQNEGSSSYTDELKRDGFEMASGHDFHNIKEVLQEDKEKAASADQKEIKKAEEKMHGTLDIKQKTMGGDLENRRNLKL
ncbi:hypothetical protein Tco_1256139 [Tanacetum coccineum]